MRQCDHSEMNFHKGKLTCKTCGKDRTPLSNETVPVVFSDYRENKLRQLERLTDGLPEEVLRDVELFAEYLKWRRK